MNKLVNFPLRLARYKRPLPHAAHHCVALCKRGPGHVIEHGEDVGMTAL